MKEDTKKQNRHDKHNQSVVAYNADADMQWFDQFNDELGVHEVYRPSELILLKDEMLKIIKNKINEFD